VIPDAIVEAGKRAIQARKKCGLWMRTTGLDNGQIQEHVHFIGVLEKAVGILMEERKVKVKGEGKEKVKQTPRERRIARIEALEKMGENIGKAKVET
jgi:Family of unknown function (DUF6604)